MRKLFALTILAAVVAGCSGQNTSLNRLQFSDETVPFPDDYQAQAARVVADGNVEVASVLVSYPQLTLGASAFEPQRWYSCLSGIPAPVTTPRLPNVEEALGTLLGSRSGVFYTVLVFSGSGGRPTIRSGYDSALCQDVVFEPITAEPPIV